MPSSGQLIVLIAPLFLLLLFIEMWVLRQRTDAFGLADTLSSLGLGLLSRLVLFLPLVIPFTILDLVNRTLGWRVADAFWLTPWGWAVAFVLYDFCYYWYHRLGHERALFWASHSVHHQSQFYNLSTALRQSGTGFLVAWMFYLPMALLGIPTTLIVFVGLMNLLYQYWIHTEAIGQLGWFDRYFASPSNHRVHHGVNDQYLDKNYSGVFMLWDHLFGTYAVEDKNEPPVYGTRSQLNTWSPLGAHVQVLSSMLKDCLATKSWRDKFYIWISRTGWRPLDCAQKSPHKAFKLIDIQRYAPELPLILQRACLVWFSLTLSAGLYALWHDMQWSFWQQFIWFIAVFAQMYLISKVMDGRLSLSLAFMVGLGFIAMLSGTLAEQANDNQGWWIVHTTSKTLALGLGIFATAAPIAKQGGLQQVTTRGQATLWFLFAATAFSWLGDVLLLQDSWFLGGLGAFLLAHLAYIGRLKTDSSWFYSKWTVVFFAILGAAYCVWLWSAGLPDELRLPVILYAFVVCAMAAQAVGRAAELENPAARYAALGALLFVFSDACIAYDRFIAPLPYAPLWILSTYYVAQGLLITNLQIANLYRAGAPQSEQLP